MSTVIICNESKDKASALNFTTKISGLNQTNKEFISSSAYLLFQFQFPS